MEQLNKVELRGMVGTVRVQDFSGKKMARFSLATSMAYTDRSDAPVIETQWHNIVAWEGQNVSGLDKIAKGSKLFVRGRIKYQKYVGNDGVEKTVTEIQATYIEFVKDDQMQVEM